MNASPVPLLVLMGVGFLVGICGHIVRSNLLIATGIGLIFIGTVLVPILLKATGA